MVLEFLVVSHRNFTAIEEKGYILEVRRQLTNTTGKVRAWPQKAGQGSREHSPVTALPGRSSSLCLTTPVLRDSLCRAQRGSQESGAL